MYREVFSIYWTIYSKDRKNSPYKIAIDTCRFTNSHTHGKGMSRLEDIARSLHDLYVDEDDTTACDENEGYEHDTVSEATQMLNTKVEYVVERIERSGTTTEIARGVMKY